MTRFVTKDSGVRAAYESGMVRDTQAGKPQFGLLRAVGVPFEDQFLTRIAMLMTRGKDKYGRRNWELANSQEEVDRFRESAERHLNQYLAGDTDEDHAAAVVFNLLAAEMTEFKLREARLETDRILDDPETMAAISEGLAGEDAWNASVDPWLTVSYYPPAGDRYPFSHLTEHYAGTETLATVALDAARQLGHGNPELYALKLTPCSPDFLDETWMIHDVALPGTTLYLGVR